MGTTNPRCSLVQQQARDGRAAPINGGFRGNLTTIKRYWDTIGADVAVTNTYYNTGQLQQTKDPLLHSTSYTYSAAFNGAYVTESKDALNHATSYDYDASSGLLTRLTDANGRATTYTYDSMLRLRTQTGPGPAEAKRAYTEYAYPSANSVIRYFRVNGGSLDETDTTFDGLGRVAHVTHVDPEGNTHVDTTYDVMGRKFKETTPYRAISDPTYGITQFTYDWLGRIKSVQNPDLSTTDYQYEGATTKITAESNGSTRWTRLLRVDGLDRLTSVCEIVTGQPSVGSEMPSDCGLEIAGSGFLTTYGQSVRGMTSVSQGGLQQRTFVYDSLSQLTDASNPESGHIHYEYDSDGRVISKTAPAPNQAPGGSATITTNYDYDDLHRLKAKTFSGGAPEASSTPESHFNYDESVANAINVANGIGRLTSEYTMLGGTVKTRSIYSYDERGFPVLHNQCTPANCGTGSWNLNYDHDAAGNVVSLSTPNVQYGFGYSSADRLVYATSNIDTLTSPRTLLTDLHYEPRGEIASAYLGNNAKETYTYDPRWLTGMSAVAQNAPVSGQAPAASVTIGYTNGSGVQSRTVETQAATQATFAALTIGGPGEQQAQVISHAATQSSGWLYLSGAVGCKYVPIEPGKPGKFYECNTGAVNVTVNGLIASGDYLDRTATPNSILTQIANAINAQSPTVQASVAGSTLTLTSRSPGSNTNYSAHYQVSTDDPINWGPAFTATCSTPNPTCYSDHGDFAMVGGTDNAYSTVWDAGSITVTIGGHPNQASWAAGSDWNRVAQSLRDNINNDPNTPVYAGGSGTQVTFAARNYGDAGNMPIVVSPPTWDSAHFGQPSFTISPTSGQLSGGNNAVTQTVWDQGDVAVEVAGLRKTCHYDGAIGHDAAWVAADLASQYHNDPASPVDASSSGGTLTLTSRARVGEVTYNAYASVPSWDSSNFSQPSLTPAASGFSAGTPTTDAATLYSFAIASYAPHGEISEVTDSAIGHWRYWYDELNRLVTARRYDATGQVSWEIGWDYDRFGNRWNQRLVSGPQITQPQSAFDSQNHVVSGVTYDAAGNVIWDGHSYTYDAENRIASVDGAISYVYDASGRRVAKQSGSAVTSYLVDASGRVIDEISSSGAWTRGEVWIGSRHLGTYVNRELTFNHSDWLGTERARSTYAGALCETISSLPFGDNVTKTGTCDPSPNFLTGKPRDSESNLDDFGARYFSSQYGRWMSADWSDVPVPVPYASLENPQSLNLYGYVGNDPLGIIDADGHGFWTRLKNCFEYLHCLEGQPLQDALQKQADRARQELSQQVIIQNGVRITAQQLNSMTNQQVVDLQRAVENQQAQEATQRFLASLNYVKIETHHLLPQAKEFRPYFERAGLDPDDYTIQLEAGRHRFKPFGVHTGEENWNAVWREFFRQNPNATKEQILDQMARMMRDFGVP